MGFRPVRGGSRRCYLPHRLCNASSTQRPKLWTASEKLIFCMKRNLAAPITIACQGMAPSEAEATTPMG